MYEDCPHVLWKSNKEVIYKFLAKVDDYIWIDMKFTLRTLKKQLLILQATCLTKEKQVREAFLVVEQASDILSLFLV